MSYFLKDKSEIEEYLNNTCAFNGKRWNLIDYGNISIINAETFITIKRDDLDEVAPGVLGFKVKLNRIQTFNLFIAEKDECDFKYDFSFLPAEVTTFTFSTIQSDFTSFNNSITCNTGRPIIHKKFVSFTGIENVFNCEKLSISNADDITQCIGFLSFLKIPRLKIVEMSPLTEPQAAALKIINDHLDGHRNLSKCQTELFKNGLKQFATT
jgi:hypothetical protein